MGFSSKNERVLSDDKYMKSTPPLERPPRKLFSIRTRIFFEGVHSSKVCRKVCGRKTNKFTCGKGFKVATVPHRSTLQSVRTLWVLHTSVSALKVW